MSLAEDAGLSEERLLAAFPDPEDVEDILATPDEALGACARTMAAALGSRSVTGPERRSAVLEPVRCIDCRHFVRSTSHPRLGRCGGGEPAHAAGGWWDTQFRACESFARSAPTDVAQSTYGYSSGR